MSTAPAATTKPAPRSYLVTWVAVIFGAGIALAFALSGTTKRTGGYATLSHHQYSPALRFDLPAGWWTSYTDRQHWRGGTIIDATGRPRVEVWLFDNECTFQGANEECVFPWGRTQCTATTKMDRLFTSLAVVNAGAPVVERAFLLKDGYLLFRVYSDEDRHLRPIIWDCMRSLQQGLK